MQATDRLPAGLLTPPGFGKRQERRNGMPEDTESRFEAWLDEKNRIVSFHEIPDSRYYSTEDHAFWQSILRMVLAGYRVQ